MRDRVLWMCALVVGIGTGLSGLGRDGGLEGQELGEVAGAVAGVWVNPSSIAVDQVSGAAAGAPGCADPRPCPETGSGGRST